MKQKLTKTIKKKANGNNLNFYLTNQPHPCYNSLRNQMKGNSRHDDATATLWYTKSIHCKSN